MKLLILLLAAFGSILPGCKDGRSRQSTPEIAVTNSYLQCVVEDLSEGQIDVLCLAPPGMCPGHFDISPAQVQQLAKCKMLLLFDFQKKIEDSLARLKHTGLRIILIETPPGLCVPDTYLTACRQVCKVLSEQYQDKQAQYAQRLNSIEERLDKLGGRLRADVEQSPADSAKVLASNHQADFADWLGLETIATFVGSDIETVSNIDRCLKAASGEPIEFVVANRQEGTGLARALASRLGAKAVVFSNFPAVDAAASGFDGLLCDNVALLLEAAGQ